MNMKFASQKWRGVKEGSIFKLRAVNKESACYLVAKWKMKYGMHKKELYRDLRWLLRLFLSLQLLELWVEKILNYIEN